MTKKKKIILIAVLAAAAAAVISAVILGGRFGGRNSGQGEAYVEPVKNMMGGVSDGVLNRYSGVVESQETWDISLNQEQKVKEILVSEGDTVEEGTPLFSYDTDDMKLQLAQAKLEMEEIGNEIKDYNSQIKALKAEKAAASKDEQFNYTVQIQSLETSIKQSEYNRQSKQMDIDKIQKSIDQSTVTSRINGVIKEINENQNASDTGEQKPFMSVLTTGDYRVKGLVNETNVQMISEGQSVILRSRVDENQIWTGTIQKIDTESAESGNNTSAYSDSSDSSSQSSRYPFYVALDSGDGLMLGQHLYIETDQGQTEAKDGVWIYSGYLQYGEEDSSEEGLSAEAETSGNGNPWVWADDGSGRLKKCAVELGEYDAELDLYQILSGLEPDDLIAWPMDGYTEGMKTTTEMEEIPEESGEGEGSVAPGEEGLTDGNMPDDMNTGEEDGTVLEEENGAGEENG